MSLDKYVKVKELGRGNFGIVSVVRSSDNGQLYVQKIIDLSKLEPTVKQAAINEASLLSSLRHPCIVGYIEAYLLNAPESGLDAADAGHSAGQGSFDSGTTTNLSADRNTLVIIMEYCSGGDIGEVIRKMKLGQVPTSMQRGGGGSAQTPFSEDQILDWFIQLALALKYCHSKHILHRDVKAQNVFLDSENRVKLGDFGISKALNSDADFAKTTLGSPYYLSPELCEGKAYGKKSDVWSLGLFLYELCTLKHAFDGATLPALVMKILKGTYPPVPTAYSPQLHALIAMMLSLDPARRPAITQILRLEFVRTRLERLSKKYPEIQTSWQQTMRLDTKKEKFLSNLPDKSPAFSKELSPPSSALPPPQGSPSKRAGGGVAGGHRANAHTPAKSHKPVSSSAAAGKSGVKGTAAAPSSRKSTTPAVLPPRPKTPPPPVTQPPPPPLPSEDDFGSDEEDEEEDEEDDTPTPSASGGGGSGNSAGAAAGGKGIIQQGWFDRAAQEYEQLMANLHGGSTDEPPPLPADPNSEDELYDVSPAVPSVPIVGSSSSSGSGSGPSTPKRKIAASHKPGASSKPSVAPSSVAAPTKHRSALSEKPGGRRRSDGPSSLALPSSRPVPVQPRASPKAGGGVGSIAASPPAASAGGGGVNQSLDAESPLMKMMAEIDEQRRRAKEWKKAHAEKKAEKKAQETATLARHKAQLRAIKTRSSLAPSPAPLGVGTGAGGGGGGQTGGDESDAASGIAEPSNPIRALSEPAPSGPSASLETPSPSPSARSPAPTPTKGGAKGSPHSNSLRSPGASNSSSKSPGPLPAGKNRRSMAPTSLVASPSPRRQPSPTTPERSASTGSTNAPESKQPSVPRPSVRDFISAKKREAALAGSGSSGGGGGNNHVPVVEVVIQRADRPDQPALVRMGSEKANNGSESNAANSSVPAAAEPTSTKSSNPSRRSLAPKREINFELVLVPPSTVPAAATASSTPIVPVPVVPVAASPIGTYSPLGPAQPILHPSADPAPMATRLPAASTTRSSSDNTAAPSLQRQHSGLPFGSSPSASPMSSHAFVVEYASSTDPGMATPMPSGNGSYGGANSASPPPGLPRAPILPPSSAQQVVQQMLSRQHSASGVGGGVELGPYIVSPPVPLTTSSSASPPALIPVQQGTTGAPARAAQLAYQIAQARSLCASMLGEKVFEQSYAYLKEAKRTKIPSEQEQERTVKGWFTGPEQMTAYSHLQSLILSHSSINFLPASPHQARARSIRSWQHEKRAIEKASPELETLFSPANLMDSRRCNR